MEKVYYDAVLNDGEFKVYDSLSDIPMEENLFCIVRRRETTGTCKSYSNYVATVIDREGNTSVAFYKNYSFSGFEVLGTADNHRLELQYRNIDMKDRRKRIFQSDIRYCYLDDNYHCIKDEWYESIKYKSIFEHFNGVAQYGEEAFGKIIELDRLAYWNDAKFRWCEHLAKKEQEKETMLHECITDVHIPDGWTGLDFNIIRGENLERVFIPSSVKVISSLSFASHPKLKDIFCFVETPPKLNNMQRGSAPSVRLYVPKASLREYQDNEDWSKKFPVIVGF